MELVATINNVPVYSDKRVQNIIDTRVEFTDGSWCDIATRQVVNRGLGGISIGASGSTASDIVTNGPERYQASSLALERVAATVTVEPYRGFGMEVTISGPKNEVKAIRASVRDNTLIISGGSPGRTGMMISSAGDSTYSRGRRNFVSTGDMFVSNLSGGGITIVEGGSVTQVTVKVPVGAPISVNSDDDDVLIGDVDGSLTACVFGVGDIKAGRMADVNLTSRGTGKIRVSEVNGSAVVLIQDAGDVTIKSGAISTLTVTVNDSGDVKVGGVAQRATLTTKDSGDIKVAHVRERPTKRVMGTGDIRVRQVG